jgi:hypothetical protein
MVKNQPWDIMIWTSYRLSPLGNHPKIFGQASANPGTYSYADENFYLAHLPITRQQILAGTTMMRSIRQSKRRRQTGSKEEAASSAPNKTTKLSIRVSVRNIDNCIEFGIPETLCCSSCQKYQEIDDRKRKNRREYRHHSLPCWKPYEDDAQCYKKPRNKIWLCKLDEWFASRNINQISASSYFTAEVEATVHKTNNSTSSVIKKSTNSRCPPTITMPDPKTTTNSRCPPKNNMPDPLLVVIGHNNTPQQELEPAQQTDQKPKRSIIIEDTTVQAKGKDHIMRGVPNARVLAHRSYLKKLQNKVSQIDELNQSVQKKKYTGTPLAKLLLASALASVPGLSLLGAELVIPLVVATFFLADSHLIGNNLDFNLFPNRLHRPITCVTYSSRLQ